MGLPKEMMTRMMHMMHKHSRRQMKAVLLVALAIPFVPGQYYLENWQRKLANAQVCSFIC